MMHHISPNYNSGESTEDLLSDAPKFFSVFALSVVTLQSFIPPKFSYIYMCVTVPAKTGHIWTNYTCSEKVHFLVPVGDKQLLQALYNFL